MITTAADIIKHTQELQPHLRLAVSASGGAIGAWDAKQERYVMVAGRLIGNHSTISGPEQDVPAEWLGMTVELLINGKPPVSDWVPVAPKVRPDCEYCQHIEAMTGVFNCPIHAEGEGR
jgi:hypothetical protein